MAATHPRPFDALYLIYHTYLCGSRFVGAIRTGSGVAEMSTGRIKDGTVQPALTYTVMVVFVPTRFAIN